MTKRFVSFCLFVLLCLVQSPATALAKGAFGDNPEAIAHASESVVMLNCYNAEGELLATGSGFAALDEGIIITNYHVLGEDVATVQAHTESGLYFDIDEVLCYDIISDIAILKTNAKVDIALLETSDSSDLLKGTRVVAIGSPQGFMNTVSEGVYSGRYNLDTEYILFSASISAGSSGGALFDESGKVIGVTAAYWAEGQNLNLAVPIEKVINLWNKYTIRNGDESLRDAEDVLGEKQGNRYESELLGIAVDFPENWYILSPEETAQAMGAVADTINDETLADQLRQAGSTCDLYAIALDESGDNLNIQLEDLGYLYGVLLTPKEYAEIALPQLKPALEQVGFTNVQIETENYEFAGRDRVSLLVTAEMNGVPVLERMILIKSGQYMASITVFSTDAERVDALLGQFVES